MPQVLIRELAPASIFLRADFLHHLLNQAVARLVKYRF